jgi:hypothetical protein
VVSWFCLCVFIVGANARNERLIKEEEIQRQKISTTTLLESQVGQIFVHQYSSIDVVINPSTLQRVLIAAHRLFLVLMATQHGFELCFEFLDRWALGFLWYIVSGWSNWWGLICTRISSICLICLDCLNSNTIDFLLVFFVAWLLGNHIPYKLVPWQLQH